MLPIGVYSKEQHDKTTKISTTLLILNIVILALNAYFKYMNMIILVMIVTLLTFIIVSFFGNMNNKLNDIINNMRNDCNYKTFNLAIQEIQDNENLHPDSNSYLELIKCEYLDLISKKKATELFLSIKKPSSAFYGRCYDELEIINHIRNNEIEEATKLIKRHRRKRTISEDILKLMENSIKIENKEVIENIEKIYKLDKKTQFENVVSAYNLMKYYYNQNNLDEAKKYAEMILDFNTDFTYINNFAKAIINNREFN